MNSDSDSSMRTDAFLPLTLLSLSLALIFVWQLMSIHDQHTAFRNTIQRQDDLVNQSHKVQAGLEKLVNDLLDLSATDDEAKAIIQKYGISRNANAAAPAAK